MGGLVTINDVLSRWRALEEEVRSREHVLSQLFPAYCMLSPKVSDGEFDSSIR